jgi:cytochrome c oxidase subunit 2
MSLLAQKRRRIVFGLVGAGATALGLSTLRLAHAQTVREIEIIAQRFKFVPAVVELKAGEPVLLQIRSLDYIHGFNVPDLGIRTDLLPGLVTPVRMTPLQVGRLDFLCDNFCGDGHEDMHGHFNVTA